MSNDPKVLDRIKFSKTSLFRTVFPGRTNHHNTLFGGEALAWMDEVAFICGTRFCRKPLVTVSSDQVDFNHPIQEGCLVELVAQVKEVGRTSLVVGIDVFVEDMYSDTRLKAISGSFKFVALDDSRRPVPVLEGVT